MTDHSDWLASRHCIAKVTADRVSEAKAYSDYIKNSEFEIINVFEQENNSGTRLNENIQMTRPDQNIQMTRLNENIPLTRPTDLSNQLNKNIPLTRPTENSPLTRPTDFEPLTRSTEFSEDNEKEHVPDDPDPEPSSSDSSSKKNKRDKKKKRCKHRKYDSSDPSSSDDSDSSDDIDYRRKRRKRKIHRTKDLIKLCARLTAKLLNKSYKSKIIRFKMDEDPLQRRIYFLTFVESLEMIFS